MTLSAQHFQANRLDLLSRLAGDISHEIKNPLHAMVINLELVRRKVEKGEPAQAIERVAIVEEEIRKVHALANGLLEALRPPREAHAVAGFASVFNELTPLISARARCARVRLDIAGEPGGVSVPLAAHELRLLLLNLADRAIGVAGPNGAVALVVASSDGQVALDVLSDAATLDDVETGWLADHPVDAEHIDLGLRVIRELVGRTGGRIAAARADDGRHRLSLVLRTGTSA